MRGKYGFCLRGRSRKVRGPIGGQPWAARSGPSGVGTWAGVPPTAAHCTARVWGRVGLLALLRLGPVAVSKFPENPVLVLCSRRTLFMCPPPVTRSVVSLLRHGRPPRGRDGSQKSVRGWTITSGGPREQTWRRRSRAKATSHTSPIMAQAHCAGGRLSRSARSPASDPDAKLSPNRATPSATYAVPKAP